MAYRVLLNKKNKTEQVSILRLDFQDFYKLIIIEDNSDL